MKKLIFSNRPVSIHLMALGLFLLIMAACSKLKEVPYNNENKGLIEEFVVETEDKLTITSNLPAYVFPYNYEGFGLALKNRLTNQVPELTLMNDDTLVTLVVHSSLLESMDYRFAELVRLLLLGRNVVIIEPTLESIRFFCHKTTDILQELIEVDDEFGFNLEVDMYPGLRQTFEGFYEMSKDDSNIKSLFISNTDDQGVFAEAIAVRGCHFHVVDRMKGVTEGEAIIERLDSLTNTIVPIDDSQNYNPEEETSSETVTPYTYGLFADVFTDWINRQAHYREEVDDLRTRGANAINTRSGTTKYTLNDISTAQKVEYTFNASTPARVGNSLPISVSIEISAVYMEAHKSDYYCVYKKVIAYNDRMRCGPQDKSRWYTSSDIGHYGSSWYEKERWYVDPYYGPFLSSLRSAASIHQTSNSKLADPNGLVDIKDIGRDLEFLNNVTIEDYAPLNTVGTTTITDTFSYGFNGGLTYSDNPALNMSVSMTWSTSTTRTIYDLECEYYTRDHGRVNWQYTGNNLPQHSFAFGTPTHSFAPEILRRECVLDQSWIWKVTNPEGRYQFADVVDVDTSVMHYREQFFSLGYETLYTRQNTWRWLSFHLAPPPRYEQKWTMRVKHSDDGEEGSSLDLKDLDAEIRTMHSDYWNGDGANLKLPDATKESRISITEFINNFKYEINNKLSTWKDKDLYGTFIFTYINQDYQDEYKFRLDVEKPSDE